MASPLSVGDCLQIASIIYKTWEACFDNRKGAPAEYAELKNEVGAMETALQVLEGAIQSGAFRQRFSEGGVNSTEKQVVDMVNNCRVTLDKVLEILRKYSRHLDVSGKTDVVDREKLEDGVVEMEPKEKRRKAKSAWSWPNSKDQNSKRTILPTFTTTASAAASNDELTTQPPSEGDKKGKHGVVLDFFQVTAAKLLFGNVKVVEIVKITDQLKFHTGCLQLFLQVLNTQSNQRIESDIDLIKQFAVMFMNTMNSSRHRGPRASYDSEKVYAEGLSTQEKWLLENSLQNNEARRVLNQILNRIPDSASEEFSTSFDKEPIHRVSTKRAPSLENEAVPLSSANTKSSGKYEPPIRLSSTEDGGRVLIMESSIPNSPRDEATTAADFKAPERPSKNSQQTMPCFSLYLEIEEPNSRTPGLLICPHATLSERWLAHHSGKPANIGNGEMFICRCGDKGGISYHGAIREFQVGFNSFCTRRVRGDNQRESEWTLEKLKRGNTSHTIRISGILSNKESCWLEENLVFPIVSQYGSYLQANRKSDLRANPNEHGLEYARYMGYCYSPHDEALIEGVPHTLPESISFAPLLVSVTTPNSQPVKELSDILHCYVLLYDTILQTEEARHHSSFAPYLAKTAEISIICGEQTKAHHGVEMILAKFSESTDFRTYFTSQAYVLEFRSEEGRINYTYSEDKDSDLEFSEDIRLNFVSPKALNTFIGVLREFQWKLFVNNLKYGKLNEDICGLFSPSVLDFKTLSFTRPKVHILFAASEKLPIRLYAESGDGESCFSIQIDFSDNNWQTKQCTAQIVENVDRRSTGVKIVTGSFSQIQFARVEDKTAMLTFLEEVASSWRQEFLEEDSGADKGESVDEIAEQMGNL